MALRISIADCEFEQNGDFPGGPQALKSEIDAKMDIIFRRGRMNASLLVPKLKADV